MSEEDSDKLEIGGDVDWDCMATEGNDSGDSIGMVATPVLAWPYVVREQETNGEFHLYEILIVVRMSKKKSKSLQTSLTQFPTDW